MKFKPIGDRVVIKRVDSVKKTPGGVFIPDVSTEKPVEGEVLAVGPGARNEKGDVIPMEVKIGDRVLFGKWSGSDVKIEDLEVVIMKETDVMGVL